MNAVKSEIRQVRELRQIIPALTTQDGAGVKIKRSLGQSAEARLDPILMLDEFNSDQADDYISGFPAHPHRGFETVTYMLDGHMLHEDHLGNRGNLRAGDVQWMTAGRGIIHSEMPQQEKGRMRGFQLWINLPAAEKMQPAAYRDINADSIPVVDLNSGVRVKVIAGEFSTIAGTTAAALPKSSVDPLYWDVTLPDGVSESLAVPPNHQLMIYPYQGEILVGELHRRLPCSQAGILTSGSTIELQGTGPTRALIIGGKAINEPIAQHGPFVMNTDKEIEQAIYDYRCGKLTET
ncbi:pirin family protein [Gilvimarinus sp. 1_MG-2023]|uniref:pirin family protein n=1 Tax=Gilvimarinus sp. 1_MG-2023 TaxID=3062638 RepID=UPI0026E198AA|nr:pirin family protein [Gilvimarinus sp. 1_MG-2023]MDO6745743.1 pirin family protein [Gilvimarinus sp. 1_MG-2023]